MKKNLLVICLLSLFTCGTSFAQEDMPLPPNPLHKIPERERALEGPDVHHFPYPEHFIEQDRFVRHGRITKDGMCEFSGSLHAKPGEHIYLHEIAYDPKTCRSLMVQGTHTSEYKKKHRDSETNPEFNQFQELPATAGAGGPSVYAMSHVWYEDPVYIDVNGVTSEIWWDPAPGCADGNYFQYNPDFFWLTLSGWKKIKTGFDPQRACSAVSLDTTAHYRNGSFPTCNKPITIFYDQNLVSGYADSSANSDYSTRKVGPAARCGDWLAENHEFIVKQLAVKANGQIGCQDRPAALFINELTLKQGDFSGNANGNDYNGSPIYFIVNGNLTDASLNIDIDMYSDASYATHIRTDHCAGSWDGNSFYDASCELTRDTTAGCVPVWLQLTKSGDATTASSITPRQDKTSGGATLIKSDTPAAQTNPNLSR